MTAAYFKPRSPKHLLRKAKADLEFMEQVRAHAHWMENRLFCDTPSDVAIGVSAVADTARQLIGALQKWTEALEQKQ
jgi:hypothetical protein